MSLLKTAARAGVASSVHGRVQRRQSQRWANQDQVSVPPPSAASPPPPAQAPPPPPAAASPPTDTNAMLEQLRQLGELRSAGVLTDIEFEVQKARILAQ